MTSNYFRIKVQITTNKFPQMDLFTEGKIIHKLSREPHDLIQFKLTGLGSLK